MCAWYEVQVQQRCGVTAPVPAESVNDGGDERSHEEGEEKENREKVRRGREGDDQCMMAGVREENMRDVVGSSCGGGEHAVVVGNRNGATLGYHP